MITAFIVLMGSLAAVLAAAACVLYPVKGEKSKQVCGFKIKDFNAKD